MVGKFGPIEFFVILSSCGFVPLPIMLTFLGIGIMVGASHLR